MTPVDFLLKYMGGAAQIPDHLQKADHVDIYERVGFSGPFHLANQFALTQEDKVIYTIINDLVDNFITDAISYVTSDGRAVYISDKAEDDGITISLLSQVVDMDSKEVLRRIRALSDHGIMSGPYCFQYTKESLENYSLYRFWHLAVIHNKNKVLDKMLNASVPQIDHYSLTFSTQNTVDGLGVLRNWSQTCCKWYHDDEEDDDVQLPTRQFFAC